MNPQTRSHRNESSPWEVKLLRTIAWIILLLSILGTAGALYLFQMIDFSSPTVILDPLSIIILLLVLSPGLVCFPLFMALARLVHDISCLKGERELPRDPSVEDIRLE